MQTLQQSSMRLDAVMTKHQHAQQPCSHERESEAYNA